MEKQDRRPVWGKFLLDFCTQKTGHTKVKGILEQAFGKQATFLQRCPYPMSSLTLPLSLLTFINYLLSGHCFSFPPGSY